MPHHYIVMRLQSFDSLEVNLPQIGKVRLPKQLAGSGVGFLAVYANYGEALGHAKDPALVREIQLSSDAPISKTKEN